MALIHGGDTEGFIREYGKPPVDFSANCNPLGLPESARAAIIDTLDKADLYPDPLSRKLSEAIGVHLGVPAAGVFCAAGAAEVIFRLVTALKPRKALLVAPGFAEYELALNTIGCENRFHYLNPENGFVLTESYLNDLTVDLDMVFLCNPNNPTARVIDPELLRRILALCKENSIMLVLDECFVGFLDDPDGRSMKSFLPQCPNLIILGAFTKIYGMAGLRLGYCLSSDLQLIESLRAAGQPWAVSSVASAAGIAALKDSKYIKRTRELLSVEREYLINGLKALGIDVLGADANFLFFKSPVPELGELCRKKGFLLRDCSNYRGLTKGYYRIAVRPRNENSALLEAIGEILTEFPHNN